MTSVPRQGFSDNPPSKRGPAMSSLEWVKDDSRPKMQPASVTFEINPTKKPTNSLLHAESKLTVKEYIERACKDQGDVCSEVLQASFGDAVCWQDRDLKGDIKKMIPIGRGGLVDVAVYAYCQHYHLVIRYDAYLSSYHDLASHITIHCSGQMISGLPFFPSLVSSECMGDALYYNSYLAGRQCQCTC